MNGIEKTINTVDKKVKEGTDKIYDRVDMARRDGKEWAKGAAEMTEDRLDQVRETLAESWDQAKEAGVEMEEKLAGYGKKKLKTAQQYVQKNPLRTAAIALVAGVVIGGYLFSRRGSK